MIYNTTFPPSELKKSNMIRWKISTFTANSTPKEKLNFQIHRVDFVVLKIWCYYMATVFALEHPGVFNHQSNDALLHLIEQTSKYDLSLQLVRTYVHLVPKIQNHLYVNTLTLYQHSQICEVTVCFETSRWHKLCVNWEKNLHETYISFHKEQNRKQDYRSDDDGQKVPNAEHEVKDVPPSFLGRQTVGRSRCHDCLPWHTEIWPAYAYT